jgi:CubicO group peptidase (beta-lactamase class C family)
MGQRATRFRRPSAGLPEASILGEHAVLAATRRNQVMPHSFRVVATGLFFVLLSAGVVEAASRPPSGQGSPASSSDAQRVERFEQQAEANRKLLKIPGLSAVILEDQNVLWAKGFGYADLEQRIPATPDTLYHIASLTKTFTAILVLQLVEQGKLDLDEPIAHYSSDFKDDSVKLKHLLSHTSDGTPGDRYQYNPERFEYLKAVLEKKTGKPLRALFVETFLDPLAMQDSVPGPDVADNADTWAMLGKDKLARFRSNLSKFAQPYTLYGDSEIIHVGYPPRDFWASAGLLSTVRDMAKYDAAVDGHRFLSQETLDRAWTPFISNASKPLAHGLGWFVTDYNGTKVVWHYGHWGSGFSAIYLKVPARHLTLVMLANSEALADHQFKLGEGDITSNLLACDFLRLFVPEATKAAAPGASSATPPIDCEKNSRTAFANWVADRRAKAHTAIQLDSKLLAPYVGQYRFEEPINRNLTVTLEGGRLFVDSPMNQTSELFPESPTKFFIKTRPWEFTFIREGSRVTQLIIAGEGVTRLGKRVEGQ